MCCRIMMRPVFWGLLFQWLTNHHLICCVRPNILFIVLDDFRPLLRCYGNQLINAPNMDNLARNSVVFTRAFAQQALCGPSRTSFLTSRRPDTTKLWDVHYYWRKSAGNFTTLPQYFKENGYHTESYGKIFHPVSGKTTDYPYSWSVPPYLPSTQQYKMKKVCPGPQGKLQMNVICPVNVSTQPEQTLPDIQSTQHALQFIGKWSNQSKPFFLALGYHKPHIPFKFPEEYLKFYPIDDIKLAKYHTKPPGLPSVAWNPWADLRERDDVRSLNVSFPYGPIPESFQKQMIQSYYASVTYVDSLLGQVFSALDRNGFSNNTITVLVGDHGWALGENQEWSKFSNFEVATRVPLLVSVPGLTGKPLYGPPRPQTSESLSVKTHHNQYQTSDGLVELVDIFPSLAELAGLPVLEICPQNSSNTTLCTEGYSFVPLIRNATNSHISPIVHSWKSAVFSQYPRPSVQPETDSDQPRAVNTRIMGYSIRTDNWRYTEWIQFHPNNFTVNWNKVFAKELYLRDTDSEEHNNVASSPQYQEIVHKLSIKLRQGWREALPLNNYT
ncbi:iduronate 2-sulfatase-like isoform X1 [Ostrea edulis]|uniref:iduronate 2-sulfatase-like isoform X1 n=1 Tax=Ostrea edulis TaxID=37623 RepID=UPI002095DB9C|nr:iduronate 2-sulfatase-like isoform X1 [Ostrea edulis]